MNVDPCGKRETPVISFFEMIVLVLLMLVSSSSLAAEDFVESCPEKFGFYADAVQCDRYYECKDGQILDQYCPDGLVFDETSTAFAKCSFPFSVSCEDRPELQKAQQTALCPRRNGYFAHEDPKVCDKFYFCVDGVANAITCPNTLIFDPTKGQCAYSDQVKRKGCSSEEFFNFACPNDPGNAQEHPRYPDPADCQYFYLCIGGTEARRNGCTVGQVFNVATGSCDRPENVEGPCRTWYNETFLETLTPEPKPALPGGGTKLDDKPGRRVAVRRKKPTEGAAPVQGQQQQQQLEVDLGDIPTTFDQAAAPPVPPAAAATGNRKKVRTRVNVRPQQQQQQVDSGSSAEQAQSGPPSFSLSSDEAIQQFRQSNRFVPEASQGNNGGGRLTVLSNSGKTGQRPQEDIKNEDFSSFPAVPNRTPPQNPQPSEEEDFGQKKKATTSDFPDFPTQGGAAVASEGTRGSLPPQRSQNRRLQTTAINVRPQLDLAAAVPVEVEEEEVSPVAATTRQRGRARQSSQHN